MARLKPRELAYKKTISKHSNILFIKGTLLFAISAIMLVNPSRELFMMTTIMGIAIVAFGMFYFSQSINSKNQSTARIPDIIFSIINIALGIILIIFPGVSFSVFIAFFAIIFLIRSIYIFVVSIDMIKYDVSSGIIGISIATVVLLISLLALMYPIGAPYAATFYITLGLIFYAITDLVLAYKMKALNNLI